MLHENRVAPYSPHPPRYADGTERPLGGFGGYADEAGGSRCATSFFEHQTVNHQEDEYVRGTAYTNTLEGYFSIFKRGMVGVYQHLTHLHRYLAEFDFRYNARQCRRRPTARLARGHGQRARLTYERLG